MEEGWFCIRSKAFGTWYLPRRGAIASQSSLLLFHPTSGKGTWFRRGMGALAKLGFKRLPRSEPPPRWVTDKLRPVVPDGGTFTAARRAWNEDRFHTLVLAADGNPSCFAKLARTDSAEEHLSREAEILRSLQGSLGPQVSAPPLLDHQPGLLMLGPVRWVPQRSAEPMPAAVAKALGALWRDGRGALEPGISHCDLSPGNLLQTATGWVIADWEGAKHDQEPFRDISHYLVQSHIVTGKPSATALIDGVFGTGPVAEVFSAHAGAAGLEPDSVPAHFEAYLERSRARRKELAQTRSWRREVGAGYQARTELLAELRKRSGGNPVGSAS